VRAAALGQKITQAVKIPTIGIGAGAGCDGQILVTHDLLGLFEDFRPRFAKQYADVGAAIRQAVAEYCREVREGASPPPSTGSAEARRAGGVSPRRLPKSRRLRKSPRADAPARLFPRAASQYLISKPNMTPWA